MPRGRKPLYADGKLCDPIWVKLPEDTDKMVRELAAEEEVDVSAMVRKLIRQALGLRKLPRMRAAS